MPTLKTIFADLVALPTVSGNARANHDALEYIDHFLNERGLFVNRHNYDGHESLVATTRQTTSPRVMLTAHVDVVPAPPRLFKLEERDGKFYGRGTCDMKFAIASYLQLVDELGEDVLNYDLGIMITTDEELGGRHGVKQLLDEAGYRAEACFLPDGGDDWAIEQAAKGLLWASVTATGTTAHGSRPWEGENAIEKMLLFLDAVRRELFAEQSNDTSSYNLGLIQGGAAVNQVADVCTAELDIRPINREEQERIIVDLNKLATTYGVSLRYTLNDSPINVDLSDPYVITFVQGIERLTGRPVRSMKSNGGSDARYFAGYDIPTLVTYPTGGGRHSDEEWLEVESFYKFHDLLGEFVSKTARTAAPLTESIPQL